MPDRQKMKRLIVFDLDGTFVWMEENT